MFLRHAKVCKKVFVSKRKPFDSAKQRMKGTELEQYCKRTKGGKSTYSSYSQPSSSKSYGSKSQGLGSFSATREMDARGVASNPRAGSLPKWKADSLSFRQAMRMAKAVSLAEKESKATGVPLHMLLPASKSMGPRKQANGSKSNSDGRSNAGSGAIGTGYDDFNDGFGAVDPSFIQCPHCGRNYNQRAGERHIPQVVLCCIVLLEFHILSYCLFSHSPY